jgi:hypothetical protein
MNIMDLKRKLLPLSGYMGDSGGGGGGGGNQTSSTTQTAELPEWARGYAKDTLAKGAALTDINQNPYQTYGANRIAGFSPMQQQAFQGAANMQSPEQMGTATDLAKAAGIGAIGTQYQTGRFNGGQFGQDSADQYMSPYMQSVVQNQQRDAQRQADIASTQRNAQATQAGAFGGSRQAIADAEAARNLALQKGDIQAQGLQSSYTNAQQQFNADQARRMQAQQLREQSRQYGAGLGMQGLQTGLQAAGQLGQLGGQQFQQGMDINKLQSAYGGQMQQQAQRPLDQAYQDFLNQQNYPYKQLGFMSDMIRGLPLGQQSTQAMYQPPGSMLGQLGGLGMGALGMSSLYNSATRAADGGLMNSYADGGSVTNPANIQGIIGKLSDQQLQQAYQVALAERDAEKANMIKQEQAQRASMRQGIASAVTPEFADQMEQGMATGGIVAFAGNDGSVVNEGENYSLEGMRTPTPAPKAKASSAKPSPVVQSAVAQLAAKTGQDPMDLIDQTKQITEMFEARFKPQMDSLRANVEASKPDNDAIRQQGIGQALAQFGFKMAANAAKPGARFLESAASASPELADAAAKTQDLIAARQKNYQDMQMKQAQFELQFNNGNMKDATLLAGQLRQQQQADKLFQFHIADAMDKQKLEEKKLGIMASTAAKQREPEALQMLQYAKQHPEDQALLEKILGQVHTGLGAAGIRAEATGNAKLADEIEKIKARYPLLNLPYDPSNPKYAASKARMDAEIAEAQRTYGSRGTSISDAVPTTRQPSMADKGFKVLGTE